LSTRPKTTYTWQPYSTSFSGGSGTVWLLASASHCATQASCAGTADETVTTFAYNGSQNLLPVSKTVRSGDNSAAYTIGWTYDADGNRLSEDGPLAGSGDTTYWRYDRLRRMTGEIRPDPDGAGVGNPMSATRFTYDPAGRVVRVEHGSLDAVPDAAIAPSNWGGFVVHNRIDTSYDIQSRKILETVTGQDQSTASLTQFSYDGFGRLECTAQRMNPAAFGSLPASACSLGTAGNSGPDRITRNVYDLAGQLVQKRVGVGSTVEAADATYSYTPSGKVAQVVDGNGNRAELRYDGFDRQSGWVFPNSAAPGGFNDASPSLALQTAGTLNENDYEAYVYDANGNRTSLRKRDNSTLSYQYDALNRLTMKVVPERPGLSSSHTRDVYYGYDLRGLQTYARFDGHGGEGISWTYDVFGRRTNETQTMDGTSRTLTSGFNASGVRTSLTHPDGYSVAYHRDNLNRLFFAEYTGPTSGPLVHTPYNATGTVDVLYRWRSGTGWYHYTDYNYDSVQRLAGFTHAFAN